MIRNIFLFVFVCAVVVSLGFAQTPTHVVVPFIGQPKTAVVIDGNLNDWNFCFPFDMNRESLSDSSRAWGFIPATDTVCSGKIMVQYDDTYLYFAAHVRDNAPGQMTDPPGWAATAVELYLSNKALTTSEYLGDAPLGTYRDDATSGDYDAQIGVQFQDLPSQIIVFQQYVPATSARTFTLGASAAGEVAYTIWPGGDGYDLEARVKWDSLKSMVTGNSLKFVPGTRVAFTCDIFHISDHLASNFAGLQYSQLQPSSQGPASWQVADIVTKAGADWNQLAEFDWVKPTIAKVKPAGAHANPTPVIDGNLIDWNYCFPFDMNRETLPDSSRAWGFIPATDTVCSGTVMVQYDDTYLYFAAHVRDNAPGQMTDPPGWAATAVELYLSNKDVGATALTGDAPLGTYRDDATSGDYDAQIGVQFQDLPTQSIVFQQYVPATSARTFTLGASAAGEVAYTIWPGGDGYDLEVRVKWDSLKSMATGNSLKFVPGTRVAFSCDIFHISDHLASNFAGLQYNKLQPSSQGPASWQVVDIGDQCVLGLPPIATVVGVKQPAPNSPYTFALSNAPNPFNPTTNIYYTLSKAGNISLKVYNLLGQQVMTLVNNEYQTAGVHPMTINMAGMTSGVYFGVLEQGTSRAVQKMMLLK